MVMANSTTEATAKKTAEAKIDQQGGGCKYLVGWSGRGEPMLYLA
jgi:hypothetical protein